MKTDDDMYVNLPLLKSHLERTHPHPHRVITGCVKNGPQGAPQPIGHNVRNEKVFDKWKHSIGSKFGQNCVTPGRNICSGPSTLHCWCWLCPLRRPPWSPLPEKPRLEAHQVRAPESLKVSFLTFSIINRVEDAFLTGYCARALGGVEKVENHFRNPFTLTDNLKVHNPNFSCGQLVAQDCDMASQFTGHKVEILRRIFHANA